MTSSTLHHHHRAAKLWTLALVAVYATWFSLYTCSTHGRFKTWAFDVGTFDQGIWLAGHDTDYFVTVRGLPLLGDHVRLFSFLLAPMYWIWDDVRALLVLQSVAIAAGAWFVCRIALRELPGRPWLALALSAGYLLNPAVQNLNLDHAHPDAFATTFILASVDFLRAGRMLPFALAAALAMSCKEDVPLVYVAMGMVAMLDRRTRRFGLVLGLISAAYFALCLAVILPHFNGAGFFRYSERGFLQGFWYQGHDPFWLIGKVLSADSIRYFFEIGLANLYLFLLAPLSLVPAVPAVIANLLSDGWYMRSLEFHYQTSVVPFLYVGTVLGLARIERMRLASDSASASAGAAAPARRLLAKFGASAPAALLIAAMVANLAWSRVPIRDPGVLRKSLTEEWREPGIAKVHELVARIPKDAVVSADYSTVPQLSHRRFIYMFPNPFEVSNWGVNGENPHDPDSVEYILLRNVHAREPMAEMAAKLVASKQFERVDGDVGVTLYRRVKPGFERFPQRDDVVCGDWDGDGQVGEEDLAKIAEAIMKNRDCPMRACDIDGDGVLRYVDILRFHHHLGDPAVTLACPK